MPAAWVFGNGNGGSEIIAVLRKLVSYEEAEVEEMPWELGRIFKREETMSAADRALGTAARNEPSYKVILLLLRQHISKRITALPRE